MTPVDPALFQHTSTAAHALQGMALIALATGEALSAGGKFRWLRFAGPTAFILCGGLTLWTMYLLLGGGSLPQLKAALELKGGFYIFPAFAWLYAAAGLCSLMAEARGEKTGTWRFFFLTLLAAIGLLYFAVASRVDEAAKSLVLARHSAIGAAILTAAAADAARPYVGGRKLLAAWCALLLAAGVQLLLYRELPSSFNYSGVTVRASAN